MKPYQKPTLTVYGRVEDITRTGCQIPKFNKNWFGPSDLDWSLRLISDCEFS